MGSFLMVRTQRVLEGRCTQHRCVTALARCPRDFTRVYIKQLVVKLVC